MPATVASSPPSASFLPFSLVTSRASSPLWASKRSAISLRAMWRRYGIGARPFPVDPTLGHPNHRSDRMVGDRIAGRVSGGGGYLVWTQTAHGLLHCSG